MVAFSCLYVSAAAFSSLEDVGVFFLLFWHLCGGDLVVVVVSLDLAAFVARASAVSSGVPLFPT